jgi:protocatechuate 3,4-dioxygenase beta subunit
MAVLLALTTCTRDNEPLSPVRSWITPLGQVVTDPPELFVGAGDIASCSITNDEATALLLDAIPGGTVFTTGDNAYEQGTDAQYANCYHPTWGRHKARTRPAPGNHEYDSPNAAGYYNYFGAAAGEIGKGYYSYNLGAWHVIVLNSSGGGAGTNVSISKGSAQEQWLLADLAANQNMCTLAIWHHPLYQSTSGTGTGGVTDTKSRAVWDDLYAAGADLVLHGHRHFYERMAPQTPDQTPDPAFGIRSITVGTGGNGHSTSTNVARNSEVRSSDTYGVLKLWLYPDSYAWKFVPVAGRTFSDTGSTGCHGAPGSGPTVSPSLSTVAASPSSLTAGSGSSTITVTVKDGNGNPMSGVTVSLAATGSGNTLTQPSGTTNASGVATGTLSSTGAGTKTVSATANGIALTQTASVTVTPGPVSASTSTVTAAPASIAAGTGSSTVTVTATDANGNPISGATVVLAATGSGNTLTQPSGTTNASGVATGTLSSTVAESKTVSATINGTAVTQTASVSVTVGAVSGAQSTVGASPTSLTAGSGSATITVTVKDASGNPISGATVVLSATGSGNTLTQPSGTTNASGVATGTFSSTGAGAKTVSATASGTAITQSASITVVPGPVSAAQSTVAAAPTSIAMGTGTATITVTARDANGNPISGATVVLAATGGGNTLTQPSASTNASGVATGTLSSIVPEAKSVSATINGTAVTQTATVNVTIGPPSAVLSTVAASPTSLAAGSGSATITVTVRDASGNPISGAAVVLAATGSGNTLTQPTGPTDGAGVATGALSSTVAQAKTVSATANGVAITQTAAVTVNPGPVSAAQSTVAASPASLIVGSGSATITVTAKDANGNPISGATVVLAATGSGNTLTQPSGTTNASGVATGSLSSTVAETKTVSATIDGTEITQTATITVNPAPVSASQSSVAAAPASLTAGSGSATITVTVRDASGNPIRGATVVLAATGSGNTLTQPSGTSDASGVATGTLSSTAAGSKTVSATANGTAIIQTATVSVTPGPVSASASTVTAAPPSIAVGTGSSTVTVTAKDANGNPISGASVTLAATGSDNTLTQPAGPTDASGTATGTLSSTVAEAKTVSASAGGVAITQTATVTVTAASSTVVLAGAANIASCGSNLRDEATATLLDAIPGSVVLVGSGAYPNGSATAYADCYGPSWGRHKARTYPTPGNQDYQTAGAAGYFGYFGTQAGDPTKGYYSFDLGDWHIIVLNTGNDATVPYGNGSAQELWLKADLAANTKLCTMAVLHNTRWFSSSTAGWFSSGATKYLWNDLYAAGADVVLSGRLYHYERMAPLNASGVRDDARGLRQFNLGNGGHTTTMPTFIAPNSEAVSAAFGVLRLNLASDSYSWEFIPIPGSTFTDSGSSTCH